MIDTDLAYRAIASRDPRFDGYFFLAVTTTGIYCRPSCPARRPKREHVALFPTAGAAQAAGYRACRRCRPDAAPGSPEWDLRGDVASRAMRLISDGYVDREGVGGLARHIGYSQRQLRRQLIAELGAPPLALARAQRTETARILLEGTDLPVTEIAFAAGFGSVRQFHETVRSLLGRTPSDVRGDAQRRGGPGASGSGTLNLRLFYRAPMALSRLFTFLGERAVPGVEEGNSTSYARVLRLPHGTGIVALRPGAGSFVATELALEDLRDLSSAVHRCRRLLDLDADPVTVDATLRVDHLLAPLVDTSPGVRVPGHVDGAELAIRAVLGQQISVPAARTLASRLTARFGARLASPHGTLTHSFADPDRLAAADPDRLPLPRRRARTLVALSAAIASGSLDLGPGADPERVESQLTAISGIGPWTAAYIRMRGLGDPDAFPADDLGLVRALERKACAADPVSVRVRAERWRPWRAYGVIHLWTDPSERGRS